MKSEAYGNNVLIKQFRSEIERFLERSDRVVTVVTA